MTEAEHDTFAEREMKILQDKEVHKDISIPEGVQSIVVKNFLAGWKTRGKFRRNLINRVLWGVGKARQRHDIYYDQNVKFHGKHRLSAHMPKFEDFVSRGEDSDPHRGGISEILSQDSDLSGLNIPSDATILETKNNEAMKQIAEKYVVKAKANSKTSNRSSLTAAQEAFRKFMTSSNQQSNYDDHGAVKYEESEITPEMLGPMWREVKE